MSNETFGHFIASKRKLQKLSQKQLAELVKIQADDGTDRSISPQYLNDIEHDRRSPSSEQLVKQFAQVLGLDADYLSFLAGRWPESLRKKIQTKADFDKMLVAFRQVR
jgi:transcriptional regulator with XRE-family HTH domain